MSRRADIGRARRCGAAMSFKCDQLPAQIPCTIERACASMGSSSSAWPGPPSSASPVVGSGIARPSSRRVTANASTCGALRDCGGFSEDLAW